MIMIAEEGEDGRGRLGGGSHKMIGLAAVGYTALEIVTMV